MTMNNLKTVLGWNTRPPSKQTTRKERVGWWKEMRGRKARSTV